LVLSFVFRGRAWFEPSRAKEEAKNFERSRHAGAASDGKTNLLQEPAVQRIKMLRFGIECMTLEYKNSFGLQRSLSNLRQSVFLSAF
jgi:hypothetical protein